MTLSVDGASDKVSTGGETVEEVLESQDIEVDRQDRVTPSLDTVVDDGSRVAVQHERQLDLAVDGERETHQVHANRVGPALEQIGHRFPDADLSASRSAPIGRDGLDVTVKTEKQVGLSVAGVQTQETTTAVTVGEALRDLGVPHDEDDQVVPGLEAPIDDDSRIRLVHLEEETRRVKESIPNETVVRNDDSMLEGKTKVTEPGRDGVRLVTYESVLADGEKRSREKVDQTVRTEPVDRVEVRGTKEPAPTAEPEPTAEPDAGISDAACPSGSDVESGLSANAVAVHRAVCDEFPEVEEYLGVREGDPGEHGQGLALDIMVYSDSATGDAIAPWVRAHASELGVSEVIWSQRIWTTDRSSEGWRPMEDRGSPTANHEDHVHVTVE